MLHRLLILAFAIAITSASAQPWTTAVRADARVIMDTNVFLQDEVPLAAGQTVRGEPANAYDEDFIWGLALTATRKPADPTLAAAELGYAYEQHRFAEYTGESHRDHRFNGSFKWAPSTSWATDGKISVLDIHGSNESPIYNEIGGVPAMGGEPVRSRRDQTITTASASALWSPAGAWKVRVLANLLDQDFHTIQRAQPYGCANYVDRGQALAGVEVGHALTSTLTGWLSLRGGKQWQDNLLGRVENFSNTFVRPLVGVEGKINPQLRVSLWAGPDFHRFTSERRAGTEASRVLPSSETTLTWTPSKIDTATLSSRQQLWFGSGGRSAYREFKSDASWVHMFPRKIEASVRGGVLDGDFHGMAASLREDRIWTAGVAAAHPFASGFRVETGVCREWSQTFIPNTDGRAHKRWLISVGVSRTW
jgi:hypothetical protein